MKITEHFFSDLTHNSLMWRDAINEVICLNTFLSTFFLHYYFIFLNIFSLKKCSKISVPEIIFKHIIN